MSTAHLKALVVEERFGAAIAPLRLTVKRAGTVRAQTTASGRLRVVLDGDDPAALERLWRSFRKRN